MAIMLSDDKKDIAVTCRCGCNETIHICIDDEFSDSDLYGLITYLRPTTEGPAAAKLGFRLKKALRILKGKDICCSEIMMSRKDIEALSEYLSRF